MKYAIRMQDLEVAWRTPRGSALVGACIEDRDRAEYANVAGADGLVLEGDDETVAACVGGLMQLGLKVYRRDGREHPWERVREAPTVEPRAEEAAPRRRRPSPRIDPEFAALNPARSEAERTRLRESIQRHGCMQPLSVWQETDILLDGHTRLSICRELRVPFHVTRLSFPDRDAALEWILDHTEGREGQTASHRRYLIGKRFLLAERRQGARRDLATSSHRETKLSPLESAFRYAKVSRASAYRHASYARQLDALHAAGGQELRDAVLLERVRLADADLERAVAAGVGSVDALREFADGGPPPARDFGAELLAAATKLERVFDQAAAAGFVAGDDLQVQLLARVRAVIDRCVSTASRLEASGAA